MQASLCWHIWWGLAESAFGRSLKSGGWFCGFSCYEAVFTLIYFMRKIYKFYTFIVIYNYKATVNSVTVQHKRVHSCQLSWVILH
jgi:hypothetical protein